MCKFLIENLTEEVVLEQFEAKPSDGMLYVTQSLQVLCIYGFMALYKYI